MNASSKLNELNAYVTGLGASQRVVVWDTTVARMTTPEIRLRLRPRDGPLRPRPYSQTALCSARSLFLGSVRRAFTCSLGCRDWARPGECAAWTIGPRCRSCFCCRRFSDFVFTPIDNAFSRHIEHQADQYGLEVVHGIVPDAPDVAAQAFQVLGEVDLAEPAPSWLVKSGFTTIRRSRNACVSRTATILGTKASRPNS